MGRKPAQRGGGLAGLRDVASAAAGGQLPVAPSVPGPRRKLRRTGLQRTHARLAAKLPDHRVQRLAVDELHGVEVDAALAADGIDGHDVGVMEPGGGLGLLAEALQMLGVEGGRKRQHLQGHPPGQRQLDGLVDDAHAAPANLADDAEVAQGIGRQGIGSAAGQPRHVARERTGQRRRLMHKLQTVEALVQRVGQVGITLQPAAAIRPPAGFQLAEVLVHGLQ